MLQLADCQCRAGVTLEENMLRAQRFAVVMAGADSEVTMEAQWNTYCELER